MVLRPRKYAPTPTVKLSDRTWPDRVLERAPIWCSVDLRDGNQALIEPMGIDRKLRFFETLVRIGIKEIEVGFPSASQTDFDFLRMLIEEQRIPSDVTIQVLTPAREHLIERTYEALAGVRRAIVHLYNSTSEVQRRVVFGADRGAILELAVRGTELVKAGASAISGTEIVFEYSPESFTGTELDFARDVCNAVAQAWGPTPERKMIVNLPATVEVSTPNVYADQIEWMGRALTRRDAIVLSVHTHNDRGCGVAAAELALLAGADRVEGTLFGNGERTGNVDLINIALNLYAQGIAPELDLTDIPELVRVYEYCNQLTLHPRHPYAGELVFTAFSGSHQDAIRKGVAAQSADPSRPWEVPYLPLDPADIGRHYEPLVRINSQSGKSGIAFVLERSYGFRLPKVLAVEFSHVVQQLADATGEELSAAEILAAFEREYLGEGVRYVLRRYQIEPEDEREVTLHAQLEDREQGTTLELSARGNGPLDAMVRAFQAAMGQPISIGDFSEHSLGQGANAVAIAYVQCRLPDGTTRYGVGRHSNIATASLEALVGGVNRLVVASPHVAAATGS